MRDSFEHALTKAWPPEQWHDVVVLVAVSGGADSTALLRGLLRVARFSTGRVIVAHFNHRLRPEADHDERFVVQLCQQLSVACEIGRSRDLLSHQNEGSLEAAARRERYDCLVAVAQRHAARYVLTAHTADDQVETILHRLLRGTGLRGLGGIPRCRSLTSNISLLRPMLTCTRADVNNYLELLRQPYCHDATNSSLCFTRNRLRHELLPLIERDYNPGVREALSRLGAMAEETNSFLEAAATQWLSKVRFDSTEVCIDCLSLHGERPLLARTLFTLIWRRQGWPEQAMSFEKWQELALVALNASLGCPAFNLPGGVRAEKRNGQLRLTRPALDS